MVYKDLADEAIALSNRAQVRRIAELDRWEAWVADRYRSLPDDALLIMKRLIAAGSLGERTLIRAMAAARTGMPPEIAEHGPGCICHLTPVLGPALIAAVEQLRLLGLAEVEVRPGRGPDSEPVVVIDPQIRAQVESEHPMTPTGSRLERLYYVASRLHEERCTAEHDPLPVEEFLRLALTGKQESDVQHIEPGSKEPTCEDCDGDHSQD